MIHHLSIAARDPQHAAGVLAELMGGKSVPFPPNPGQDAGGVLTTAPGSKSTPRVPSWRRTVAPAAPSSSAQSIAAPAPPTSR